MYVAAGHLLMALGAWLLYVAFDWHIALGAWCLVEGAAVFAVGLVADRQDEPSPRRWLEPSD